jgi:hypothetical protein
MLVVFYRMEDEGVKEIHTSPNLLHFRFPCWETNIELLDSQVPPSGYRQTDVRQIFFSNKNQNWKKMFLSVRFAELMTFQCSKVIDVDDDMYQISQDMVHATTLVSLSPLLSLSTVVKRIIIAMCSMP